MPKIGDREFPYTAAGKKAAANEKKKQSYGDVAKEVSSGLLKELAEKRAKKKKKKKKKPYHSGTRRARGQYAKLDAKTKAIKSIMSKIKEIEQPLEMKKVDFYLKRNKKKNK